MSDRREVLDRGRRIDPDEFRRRYRADPDPWHFATDPNEQYRYDLTVAMLPNRRFIRAFEPGAATGELSRRLAETCDSLITLEPAPEAVAAARARLRGVFGVDIRCGVIPEHWPAGRLDLVVLSEIGYYFDRDALAHIAERAWQSRIPRWVVATHWLGTSDDHELHGDDVHAILTETFGRPIESHRERRFRSDLWCTGVR